MIIGAPGLVHAHGAGYGIDNESRVVAVRFLYSGGLPMSYAQIKVFGPGDEENQEFQNGRSDALGRFAFVPDRIGIWRIDANDGMGHAVFAEVEVPDDDSNPLAVSGQGAQGDCFLWKSISGISLIALLFWGIHICLGRRRSSKE